MDGNVAAEPTAGNAPAAGLPEARRREPLSLGAQDLEVGYDRRTVLHGLSVEVPTGRITMIIGANACGKSTLLRTLARLLRPRQGRTLLGGKDIRSLRSAAVARELALLPQSPIAPDGITVADLVSRGRYPRRALLRRWSAGDDQAVAAALAATGTADLAERLVQELSGGQRQRVWMAMVLAQETDILLLDEPTSALDLAHQIELLELLTTLNAERGCTVVVVLHDLNQAARYAHHLIAMKQGRIVAAGPPAAVITADTVEEVFGLPVQVVSDPVAGTPMVVPLGRRPARSRPG